MEAASPAECSDRWRYDRSTSWLTTADLSGRASDRIRVVAVSKAKPVPFILQVYDAGHRHFGGNYAQELVEKAPQLPDDIEWRFIGNLQSNKVKPLLNGVPKLSMVETVDDEKIANNLDRVVGNSGRKPLKVLVQLNTSGEESKSGVEPAGCVELDKNTLANCRSEVCKALGMAEEQCELSMGMSGDFEMAIDMGSTNVRIGSTVSEQGNIQRNCRTSFDSSLSRYRDYPEFKVEEQTS